eukprot:jgi/Mesvir1/10270/Mv07821-RA.1
MACACKGYAAKDNSGALSPREFQRRALRKDDVKLRIRYVGMVVKSKALLIAASIRRECHPMQVIEVGPGVTRFKEGDKVAVGALVDSCRECDWRKAGKESYCVHPEKTYTFAGKDKY